MALSGCTQKEVIDLPRGTATAEMEAAVDSFVEATKSRPAPPDSIQLHSIMIVKNGKVLLERWFNGEAADKPHVMHSVSKTFTATAIGLAISEGKLNLMDKVVRFFPDQLPADSSEYQNDMTIRDLLTMTCGHDEEPNVNKDTVNKVDWVTGFLAWPVKHKPGEYYLYNSVGTYMLSAINCGGWGLHLKTEDMAKMGQLFLQKGEWNGQQIVPAEWLKEMSSYQVPSAPSGTRFEDIEKAGLSKDNNEWVQGYGYQMRICRHNAFRADGYAGQYIFVFPDRDAVLVLTTSSSLYQPYIDLIWEYLLPVL